MTSVHVRVWVPVLAIAAALVACGASDAVQSTPATPSGTNAAAAPSEPVSQDAGPTTTTTLALGSGGGLDGAKLSSSSSQTIESAGAADAGAKGPHAPEVGRGVKDIQAIVVSRRDEARACYDAALKAHPGIEGNLDIRWTIDPKGNVSDIAVDTAHSDILEPTVGNCVIAILKKIHFNESPKGFETQTHYPFNFHPRAGSTRISRPDGGH